jgi:hypothetical protein
MKRNRLVVGLVHWAFPIISQMLIPNDRFNYLKEEGRVPHEVKSRMDREAARRAMEVHGVLNSSG